MARSYSTGSRGANKVRANRLNDTKAEQARAGARAMFGTANESIVNAERFEKARNAIKVNTAISGEDRKVLDDFEKSNVDSKTYRSPAVIQQDIDFETGRKTSADLNLKMVTLTGPGNVQIQMSADEFQEAISVSKFQDEFQTDAFKNIDATLRQGRFQREGFDPENIAEEYDLSHDKEKFNQFFKEQAKFLPTDRRPARLK